jgi:hypothetical protein
MIFERALERERKTRQLHSRQGGVVGGRRVKNAVLDFGEFPNRLSALGVQSRLRLRLRLRHRIELNSTEPKRSPVVK